MLLKVGLILFSIIFFIIECQKFSATPQEIEAFFDEELSDDNLNLYQVAGCAVSIHTSSGMLWSKGYGYEDYDKNIFATNKTVFGIGSISKTFIAASLMLHFEDWISSGMAEKKINDFLPPDLQPPNYIVGNYIVEDGGPHITPKRPIKMKNLVTHTSGFDEARIVGMPTYGDDLRTDIKHNMPYRIRNPDIISSYNNYGTALAALIVELSAEKSYQKFLEDEIFSKLKMDNTYYMYKNAKNDKHACKLAYRKDGKVIDYPVNIQDITAKPCGAVFSSHLDFAKFIHMLMNRGSGLLKPELADKLFEPLFKVFQIPPINLIFYDTMIFDQLFKGHDGDIDPNHAKLAISFDKDVSFFFTMSGRNGALRDVLLNKFTLKFLKDSSSGKEYCEVEKGGEIIQGVCEKNVSLSNNWVRDSSVKWEEEYSSMIGCYVSSRHIHSSWMKILSFLTDMPSALCFDIYDKKYLQLNYVYTNMNVPVLILENIFYEYPNKTKGWAKNDYIIAPLKYSLDKVTIPIESSQNWLSFKHDIDKSNKKKYWIISSIVATYEYWGTREEVQSYITYIINTTIFTTIIIAIMVLFCGTCCLPYSITNLTCICRRNRSNKFQEEYKPLLNEKVKGINDSDIKIKPKKKAKKKEEEDEDEEKKEISRSLKCCLISTFVCNYGMVYILAYVSMGITMLHYLSSYVSVLSITLFMDAKPNSLTFQYWLPLIAIILMFLAVVIFVCVTIFMKLVWLFVCFKKNLKNFKFLDYLHYGVQVLFIMGFMIVGIIVTIMYYRIAFIMNVFMHD